MQNARRGLPDPEFNHEIPANRAAALLEANLTAGQREQYYRSGSFEVIGGATGRRYRIRRAGPFNVDELDGNGEAVATLCFVPAGSLAGGDVVLTQKIALELFEADALSVARRSAVGSGDPHLQQRNARLGDRLFRFDLGNAAGFRLVEQPRVFVRVMNGTRLLFDDGIRYWNRDGVFQSTQTVADVCLLPGDGFVHALALTDICRLPLRQLCPDQRATVARMPDPQQIHEEHWREFAFWRHLAQRTDAAGRAWAAALAEERASSPD